MRKEVVLDIETQNTFQDVGAYNPTLLSISLIGVYFYETDSYESFLEGDLPKLWPRLERADRIIGYNLFGFDYPCMQRYYTGELKALPTIDLLAEIEKSIGFRVKLDDVAHATLGVGKSGHGLMAVDFWRKGEIDKLREYCLQDVKITKDVYEYALEHKEISYFDRQRNKQIARLSIDSPVLAERVSINLSLGL